MKTTFLTLTGLVFIAGSLSSCDQFEHFEAKARKINQYERVALKLAKENRELKNEIARLKNEIQVQKSEKSYLKIKLDKFENKRSQRTIASIAPVNPQKDLVKFDTYNWSPTQILSVAQKEFEMKNYEKSAQYFMTFSEQFPKHENVDDLFLYQAGVSAYESGKHPEWTLKHLEKLVKAYPTSRYYRGAKLWMALTYLNLGQDKKFFSTVEEFRKKYRNTDEWKVLSPHYEKIIQKYK